MRKKKEEKENSERWLLTYSDMITLLLALFILLYGMSTVDQSKYEALAVSLNSSLGDGALSGTDGALIGNNGVIGEASQGEGDAKATTDSSKSTKQTDKTKTSTTKNMEDLKSNIDNIIASYYSGKDVTSSLDENGLVITFSSNVFFDSGKETLNDDMKLGLDKMALQLNKIGNYVLVEGHTDNVPTNNSKYSSNWQLSAVRAANVVQYLVEEGKVDSNRLSAVGCGENKPVASNDTATGRIKNRRIDLIILNK